MTQIIGPAPSSSLGADLAALWSWSGFVLFTIIPVAFAEIVRWIYEWQVLETGILAIVAAHLWGRSIVRAAQITTAGQAKPQARRRREKMSERDRAEGDGGRDLRDAAKAEASPVRPDWAGQVHGLREQVRMTLGAVPCVDDVLTPSQLELCREVAAYTLDDPPADCPQTTRRDYEQLKAELAALARIDQSTTCHTAWDVLVRVSKTARLLLQPAIHELRKPESRVAARG